MRAFFRSEHEEAALRVALDDAGALFRAAPEAKALVRRSRRTMEVFVAEAAPAATPAARAFAADFLMTGISALAEKVTEQGRSRDEVDAWAVASAELYCTYLKALAAPGPTRGRAG